MTSPSRLEISIPTASFDGVFHGRYPHGDAPAGAALSGAASDSTSASAAFAGTGGTFDFYIGPRAGVDANPLGVTAGNDSNSGTSPSSPWAVTSLRCTSAGTSPNFSKINGQGVRVGFLPGIYDISGLMQTTDPISGGIQMPGGNATKINYFASSDQFGNYSPRTATFDGRGATHLYGSHVGGSPGNWDGPVVAFTGVGLGSQNYVGTGWITFDGLCFTGHSFAGGLRVGGNSFFTGCPQIVNPTVITNCEFFYKGFNQVGMILTFGITAGGSGYLPASGTKTYFNVPLGYVTSGGGTHGTADITVTNGVVTNISGRSAAPNVANAGLGYSVNDQLTALNSSQSAASTLPPGGSGFVMTVNSIGTTANGLDNGADLWVDHQTNAVDVINNWIHDGTWKVQGSGDHNNAILYWGNTGTSTGVKIRYNTIERSGTVLGKELGISQSKVTNNYLDCSDLTTAGNGFQDFTGCGGGSGSDATPSLTGLTTFANNIVIANAGNTSETWDYFGGIPVDNLAQNGWNTPVTLQNNLLINKASSGGAIFIQMTANPATNAVGGASAYNNLYYNPGGGTGGGPNGSVGAGANVRVNPAAVLLLDYNMYPPTTVVWAVAQNAFPLTTNLATYTTKAAFTAGLATNGGPANCEANSITGTPTFVGSGLRAAQFKLQSGSAGQGAGKIGGVIGGAATDMGAWGGNDFWTGAAVAQIGCSFAT